MLAIGIPAFRIIGITAIISGMTIMMSGVFQAMNSSSKALLVSIVQAVTLVGSAALLALAHNTSVVWVCVSRFGDRDFPFKPRFSTRHIQTHTAANRFPQNL